MSVLTEAKVLKAFETVDRMDLRDKRTVSLACAIVRGLDLSKRVSEVIVGLARDAQIQSARPDRAVSLG